MKQEKKKSGFFPRKRTKYKLTFFNENTLEDVWTICFSRTGAILTMLFLGIIAVGAIVSIIVGTPIKSLLPGYMKNEERIEVVDNILRIDSLTSEINRQSLYIDNLSAILSGEIKIDSIGQQGDSLLTATVDSLLPESKRMADYVQQYEEAEKYNLTVFSPTTPVDGKIFYTPLKGKIVEPYNPQERAFGIEIECPRGTAVSSVLDGTVISAGYTIDYGYVIAIQHPNDYLSIYKYNSGLLKKIGDKVQGGEKIALSGWEKGKSTQQACRLEFQLWHTGQALDPEKYITF